MIPRFIPTASFEILGGSARVLGFGAQEDDFNFSLKDLQVPGDELKPDNEGLTRCLRETANQFDVRTIYAPRPVHMNSEIVGPENLNACMVLGFKSLGDTGTLVTELWRGADADGVRLPQKSMFAMSAADCALIVVKWRDQVWATHAGRDSLIDRRFIDNGRCGKPYDSVVESIMMEIPEKFWGEVEVFIGCTISSGPHFEHPVDDPKYGEFNRKMLEFLDREYLIGGSGEYQERGQIDMKLLIQRQFERFDVTRFEVDKICTFSDKKSDGSFKWYSNRRDKLKRNLFLVVRK